MSNHPRRNDLFLAGIVSMAIDHIGYVFFPGLYWLRWIGRLAMPAFAFGLARGFTLTSDRPRYFGRILIFALLAQIPFSLLFVTSQLNILFLFAACLALLYFVEQRSFVLALFLGLALAYIPFDYGLYGAAMVLIFYLFRNSPGLALAAQSLLVSGNAVLTGEYFQLFALPGIALVLYWPFGPARVRLPRYFFYWFYPLHLFALWLITRYF